MAPTKGIVSMTEPTTDNAARHVRPIAFADQGSRARCTCDAASPCPRHFPHGYAKWGAKHKAVVR